MQEARTRNWKNPSVTLFSHSGDPVAKMLEKASDATFDAMEQGWSGPPFDPFVLAEMRGINIVPNSQILDARTVPIKSNHLQIEYNPNRPSARQRYSIAHEIAHTFFPDCGEQIRNRAARTNIGADDWELEMLCNIGAAEILMPTGCLSDWKKKTVSIQDVLELRRTFEVSTESILLRLIKITEQPYAMFVASRGASSNGRYKIDYSTASRTNAARLPTNAILPKDTVVATCTAIGFSATSRETWPGIGPVEVECVGVAPYTNSVFPRVIGIVRTTDAKPGKTGNLQIVTGDATEPYGDGPLILAHVVNDATPNWGAGFGKVVQQKWPCVQSRFRDSWLHSARKRLGDVFFSEADLQLTVCQMVCQRGYGNDRPRLRYAALRNCLTSLRDRALDANATVHMPRIGTGEAGGSWTLVSALLDEVLCAAGLSVTIYDLPNSREKSKRQHNLF